VEKNQEVKTLEMKFKKTGIDAGNIPVKLQAFAMGWNDRFSHFFSHFFTTANRH
jgi:hypothetical protein